MQEICHRIGVRRQDSRDVVFFWHERKNEEISDEVLDSALSELYPAALNCGDILTYDAVVVFSRRRGHVQLIAATHELVKVPIYSDDEARDLLFDLSRRDRALIPSMRVVNMIFDDPSGMIKSKGHVTKDRDYITAILDAIQDSLPSTLPVIKQSVPFRY